MSGLYYSEDVRAPEYIASPSEIDELDRLVQAVAAELPFPVETEADMGGTFILQIDLGTRGDDENDEHDRAGIDGEPDAVWWLDVRGDDPQQFFSELGRDADPAAVSQWIAAEARRMESPAAVAPRLAETARESDSAAAQLAATGFPSVTRSAVPASVAQTRSSTAPNVRSASLSNDLGR